MCIQYIKIKSKSEYAIKSNFLPCGKCSDCRKSQASSWTWRLNAEIEEYAIKQNYNCGFFTLTYNDAHLPKIPKKFFTFNNTPYSEIPCFNYNDIKKFTDCIRTYLWRTYGIKNGFRYFITSEYGELRHRPHYHGILLWPKEISYQTMYQIIEDAWTGSKNIIPNNRKSKRKNLGHLAPFSTFEVKNKHAAGAYVAKYVCKDLAFEKQTKWIDTRNLSKAHKNELRHYSPFHKQSLAFGACAIKNKSDEEILDLFKNGINFTANPVRLQAPTYIKNKILFDTYKLYNLKTHKYETRKKYSKFMFEHKKEIYDKKIQFYQKFYTEISQRTYWEINKTKNECSDRAYNICNSITSSIGIDNLAYFHTLYYGINYKYCKNSDRPENLLFARYNPCADLEHFENIDKHYYDIMSTACDLINGYTHLNIIPQETENELFLKEIRDFFISSKYGL